MSSSPFTSLRRHCCFTTFQLAEKNFRRANELISTGENEDAEEALAYLDTALELHPNLEKALELKARILLYLKRFKEVVALLHEFLPGLANLAPADRPNVLSDSPALAEKLQLNDVGGQYSLARLWQNASFGSRRAVEKARGVFDEGLPESRMRSAIAKFCHKLCLRSSSTKDLENGLGWRYLILGQACCHLGMMEDAMLLLQNGKRTASAASRRFSNSMRDDNFSSEIGIETTQAAESDLVNHMLANIKLLLRRRAAAEAALEAGLYDESVRHFTKIVDNSKSTPPGFLEDCYLHRAIAYQATGRVVDAIADCNRTLALNPRSTKALSVRASLHEMVKSFSECLLDLQQLKMIYEAALRRQQASVDWSIIRQSSEHEDLSNVAISGSLDYINSKIMATRCRLSSRTCSLAARTILDVPLHCTMEDVEKAYLLLTLKHSPDQAALFVENCAYQDRSRDIKTVKEEARASALRLSQLIHKAYTKLLSVISEEEAEEQCEFHSCVTALRLGHRADKSTSSEDHVKRSLCWVECSSNPDRLTGIEASVAEGKDEYDDEICRFSVCSEVADQEDSAGVSNFIASVDLESKTDIGYDQGRCIGDPVRMRVNNENVVSEQTNHTFVEKVHSNLHDEDKGKAVMGCFQSKMCNEEGDDKKVIMVIMKALASFKQDADPMDTNEASQQASGELRHLVSSFHGGACSEVLANAISEAFSMDNPNLSAHQRWLMNISGSSPWNLPLSQPLSVT